MDVSGMKIRTSSKRIAQANDAVSKMSSEIRDIVTDPEQLSHAAAQTSITQMEQTSQRVARFIANNPVLEQTGQLFEKVQLESTRGGSLVPKKGADTQVLQSHNNISASLDNLTATLRDLGAITSKRRGVVTALSKLPFGVGKKISAAYAKQFETLKRKIQEVDTSLVGDVALLNNNIDILLDLRQKSAEEAQLLGQEIISLKLLADELKLQIIELEKTDSFAAMSLKSEVMPRLQRLLSDKMGLYGVLTAAQEAIGQVVHLNNRLIEDANNLRNVAVPAITVSTTITATAIQAKQAAARHMEIKNLTNQAIAQIGIQVQEANKLFYEVAGQPTIRPEVLGGLLERLAHERETRTQRDIEIGQKLEESNRQMAEVFSQHLISSDKEAVGVAAQDVILRLVDESNRTDSNGPK